MSSWSPSSSESVEGTSGAIVSSPHVGHEGEPRVRAHLTSALHATRILIACTAPLEAEYGAGQMALNLAAALRGRGHHVDVWTPPPGRWWSRHRDMRRALDSFLASHQRYDVIDAPSYLTTSYAANQATVVVRSVQPELQYLYVDRLNEAKRLPRCPAVGVRALARLGAYCLYDLWLTALILRGWSRAHYILCLGSLEYRWMQRYFPIFQPKLHLYVNALAPQEQWRLAAIRAARRPVNAAIRFVWIGRWSAHKGTARLLDFIKARAEQFPEDRFTIAGYGRLPDHDARFLASHPAVTLVPRFSRDELDELLANHDIGLFTSEVEGWGLVLNEMVEAGMTVYAVEAGGVPDLRNFTNAIQAFPPPVSARFPVIPSISPEYFRQCNWATIAMMYEQLFINPLSISVPTNGFRRQGHAC